MSGEKKIENTPETKETPKGIFQQFLESKNMKASALGNNAAGTEMILVEASDLIQIIKELKKSKGLKFMTYMTAVDLAKFYQIVIQIEKHESKEALIIKVNTAKERPLLPSLSDLFAAANWAEREAYDLMGIEFEGHPNLKRILNPDNWQGYPLRKDYIGPLDELNEPINYSKN
jgi:NADH:ubiquinone oxidoreductase subunit C